jgi:uncharacterized Fe-S center protein
MGKNANKCARVQPTTIQLPTGLTLQEEAYPTVFVDIQGMDVGDKDSQERINKAIYKALHIVHSNRVSGQTLLKVHVGEPKCFTRMRPEYVVSSVRFLQERGASGVVAGDTTVAYSGLRGHKQNPPGDTSCYLGLAQRHGWSTDGAAGIPFVVLDRPCSAVSGGLEFSKREERTEVHNIHRFKDFFLAGGFAVADFIINHAHLTLHGLAGLAGCVKSIAMGCSALKGKLRMHQSLLPHFNSELCVACGRCVESCPEDALKLNDGDSCPVVYPELCIGCGECEMVCVKGAVTLQGEEITDWQLGKDTLPLRMADYTMGLMNGRWEDTIHLLHMYSITERCDCLNVHQEPLLQRDLGFLVSKNPFAIDQLAGRMLTDALVDKGNDLGELPLEAVNKTTAYVQETYGLLCETLMEKVKCI